MIKRERNKHLNYSLLLQRRLLFVTGRRECRESSRRRRSSIAVAGPSSGLESR